MAANLLGRRLAAPSLLPALAWILTPASLFADPGTAFEAREDAEGVSSIGVPFAFVENRGQWDTPACFMARQGGITARFERDAMVLQLERRASEGRTQGVVVRLAFAGASPSAILEGEERRRGVCNFFLGTDASKWHASVPRYTSVVYRGLYEGIEVRVRESAGQFEYDLLLAPGANLDPLVIRCDGVEEVKLAPDGGLILQTALGPIRQAPPTTWCELPSGERRPVECRYRLVGERGYGFEVPGLDRDLALVIDPTLQWMTYLGGNQSDSPGRGGLVVDESGFVTLAGGTYSSSFPTKSGTYQMSYGGNGDAFIVRFDPTQLGEDQLVWATFLGGGSVDWIESVALGSGGELTVVGGTQSTDFPTTVGAYATSYAGGGFDGFAARLDANGQNLIWSTYFGGSGNEWFNGVALHGADIVTVTGSSTSSDLPTTIGAFDTSYNGAGLDGWGDGLIVRLDPSLTGTAQLLYSTFVGGSGDDLTAPVAVDAAGIVTTAGRTGSNAFPTTPTAFDTSFNGSYDGHVIRMSLAGNGQADLLYGTYLGGSNWEGEFTLDMDALGMVTIAGWTRSSNFPTTSDAYDSTWNGLNDGCVARLSLNGTGGNDLVCSTFFGTSGDDRFYNVSVDESGGVTVTGRTNSTLFPTTPDAHDLTYNGSVDAILTRFLPTLGGITYSTYIGGSGGDVATTMALDGPDVVLAGGTNSQDLEFTEGAYDSTYDGGNQDIFLCILGPVSTAVAWDEDGSLSEEAARVWLSPPTPNPTRGLISYDVRLEREASVRVAIFDVHGHLAESLWEGELPAGSHRLEWNTGPRLPAGVYYLRLEAGEVSQTRSVVLVR